MSWINRQIARAFPGYALKREVAQMRLDRLKSFVDGSSARGLDAIPGGRARGGQFLSDARSPDATIEHSVKGYREHVRNLEYNNGFVAGAIKRIVNNVVGTGFVFQSRVKPETEFIKAPKINRQRAKLFNTDMERNFKLWAKQSDVRLVSNFNEQQSLAEGALLRDGAALVIGRNSKRKGRIIPFCLELLEIDRLQTPPGEITNPKIRNGIEYDDEGVRKWFYVLKEHPGETNVISTRRFDATDFEQVPAWNPNGTQKVFYLFNPIRPEQMIGLSQFSAGLKDLQDLDRVVDAEKLAMLEDACLTGFVKTTNPTGFQSAYTEASGKKGYDRIHEFAPNKWHYLNPGEDIDIHSPKRPNEQLQTMIDQLLRGPANSVDVPPEIISQNWSGFNYSNARTVLLQFYLPMRIRQRYLEDHLTVPVYANVAPQMVAKGLVQAPGFDRRLDAYLRHTWQPNGWQWVDPVKEATGKKIEVRENFDSVSNVCASKGYDAEEILEANALYLKRKKELETEHDIKFPEDNKGAGRQPGSPAIPPDSTNKSLKVVK